MNGKRYTMNTVAAIVKPGYRLVDKGKEGHFIIIKGQIHQEDMTITNG